MEKPDQVPILGILDRNLVIERSDDHPDVSLRRTKSVFVKRVQCSSDEFYDWPNSTILILSEGGTKPAVNRT
jgi:hypothetical protein